MSTDSCCCECPCVLDDSWSHFFRFPNKSFTNEVTQQMFASSMGSIVTTLVLNPLSVIKVRLQNKTEQVAARSIVNEAIKEKRLFRTLWSGTSSGLMLTVPNTVSYMVAYERCKLTFNELLPSSISILTPALSGAASRAFSVSVVCPLELARTIQASGVNESVTTILRDIFATHGIRGICRGWTSTILRDCPYSAIYWVLLENMRPHVESHLFHDSTKERKLPQKYHPISSFVSGASAGLFAALCTHPLDVLKTRRQLSALVETSSQPHALDLVAVYKSTGLRGIFRGLSMRLLTVIPASAIMITIYEYCK